MPLKTSGKNSGHISDPEDFIQALVIQQNDRSAKLLDTMLARLPLQTCMPDKENIINEVITAIWDHPCPACERLREMIKTRAESILSRQISVSGDPQYDLVDTSKEYIRW